MKKNILFLLVTLLLINFAKAQYNIASNNGQIINTCSGIFMDNSSGNYAANVNQTITFHSNNTVQTHIKITFTLFNVDISDTLFVFDGLDTLSPLIGKFNNNNPLIEEQSVIHVGLLNTSGALTFRFKTNDSNQASGWSAIILCTKACQKIISSLDTILTLPNPSNGLFLDACLYDSITFVGNGIFPQNNIQYHQHNGNCYFEWNFGDSTTGSGKVIKHKFNKKSIYYISLTIIDGYGCVSTNKIEYKVRLSNIPDLYVIPQPDMCTGDTATLKVGYLNNSNIVIQPSSFFQGDKYRFDSTIFIPDGPACLPGISNLPIIINTFPTSSLITAAKNIKAICVNLEHSYTGDLGFKITCPNGQSVVLDPNTHSGGAYLGNPYGGTNHGNFDNGCLPANNPIGTGWNYCWSETYPTNGHTLDWLSSNGGTSGITGQTIDSTNQVNHTNYIVPANPFSSLIGCPVNGTWIMQITDDFGIDNGYVFHWDFQLQSNLTPASNNYSIFIDSVNISGPYLTSINDSVAKIHPLTPGNYNYPVSLFDNFGCKWDTSIHFFVGQTPTKNLGNDTTFCEGNSIILNAGNLGALYQWNYSDVFGSTMPTLITKDSVLCAGVPFIFDYIVKVTNPYQNNQCSTFDTIKVTLNPKPELSFLIDNNFLCDPAVVYFDNLSSPLSATYNWSFGDGQTSTQYSPYHTYTTGNYSVNLTATSIEGCTSISNNTNLIEVYPKPNKPVITIKHGISDTLISNINIGNQWYKDGIMLAGDTNKTLIISPNANGYFVDVVTNDFGCKSDMSNYIYVGIDENTFNNNLFIYPNPFKDIITIKYSITKPELVKIYLCDITGRELNVFFNSNQDKGTYNLAFKMAELKSGLYTLTLSIGNNNITKKIVKID